MLVAELCRYVSYRFQMVGQLQNFLAFIILGINTTILSPSSGCFNTDIHSIFLTLQLLPVKKYLNVRLKWFEVCFSCFS